MRRVFSPLAPFLLRALAVVTLGGICIPRESRRSGGRARSRPTIAPRSVEAAAAAPRWALDLAVLSRRHDRPLAQLCYVSPLSVFFSFFSFRLEESGGCWPHDGGVPGMNASVSNFSLERRRGASSTAMI